MQEADNLIMPPSVALTFLHLDHTVCSVPVFVLIPLAREQSVTDQNEFINALDIAADHTRWNLMENGPCVEAPADQRLPIAFLR
jgi:hypothetical protein